MQVAGEAMFPPEFAYSDGRPGTFPARPKHGRGKHGGGIGKAMVLLKPYFVKRKGRRQCLCPLSTNLVLKLCIFPSSTFDEYYSDQ